MKSVFICVLIACFLAPSTGCHQPAEPISRGGVSIAAVTVPVGSDGWTAEQRNVRDRLKEDNKPGSIKHLYVISAYSGDVIIYSHRPG